MNTENGSKIFDYYATKAEILEFAYDWMEFFTSNNVGNEMYSWWKWCDEFAEWILSDEDKEPEAYGLIKENADV